MLVLSSVGTECTLKTVEQQIAGAFGKARAALGIPVNFPLTRSSVPLLALVPLAAL